MIAILRHLVLLAAAAIFSWWLLFGALPLELPPALPQRVQDEALAVTLAPAPPAPRDEHAAVPPPEPASPPAEPRAPATEEPTPPPPELGTSEGRGEAAPDTAAVEEERELEEPPDEPEAEPEAAPAPEPEAEPAPEPEAEPEPEPEPAREAQDEPETPAPVLDGEPTGEPAPPEPARSAAAELMRDPELLAAARAEFAGESRKGFATTFLSSAEDQLEIARFFGEELVLVPKRALDPEGSGQGWFRLAHDRGAPRVVAGEGRPPLEQYRQYRDLFEYQYAQLPEPLRELRRAVLSREEVYLFAALIPAAEWAVVIGRRDEALAASGRVQAEVRRFVLRTVRTRAGGFDFRVEEIHFDDGTRYRPGESETNPR